MDASCGPFTGMEGMSASAPATGQPAGDDTGCPVSHQYRRCVVKMKFIVVLSLLFFSLASVAHAGKRNYVWSYDYGIGPKDGSEVEMWWTAKTRDSSRSDQTKHEVRVEVEVPITDRWESDFYLVFTKNPDESTDFSDLFWSNKYLLTLPGQTPVDMMGYFEVKRPVDFHEPWEFEAILILSKDFRDFNLTGNIVYEGWLDSDNRDHDEIKTLLATGYAVTPRFNLGAEIQGIYEGDEQKFLAGPTLSFSLNRQAWVAIGPSWGLNDDADDFRIRALFGIFL
jgi:hypothetical protein